jgi:hypothetical protein
MQALNRHGVIPFATPTPGVRPGDRPDSRDAGQINLDDRSNPRPWIRLMEYAAYVGIAGQLHWQYCS